MVATSQRFEEIHNDIEIHWEKRSLSDFGEYPIDKLAMEYDLVIMDHPWSGFAEKTDCFINLSEAIDKDLYENLFHDAIGSSAESYLYNDNQVAMAIDAAAPVALYSPDKLSLEEKPDTWTDVIRLAKGKRAISAGNPTSLLMEFYMFCSRFDPDIFKDLHLTSTYNIETALEIIAEYFSILDPICFEMNPIAVHEILSQRNSRYCYTPCEFGYSNYCRSGYTETRLKASDPVTFQNIRLRTVLGGAGIAISKTSKNIKAALDYLLYSISPEIQSTIYGMNGGQPASREAWNDKDLNNICNNFFADTALTLETAILRPRFPGYIEFQDKTAICIQEAIKGERTIKNAADTIRIYYEQVIEKERK